MRIGPTRYPKMSFKMCGGQRLDRAGENGWMLTIGSLQFSFLTWVDKRDKWLIEVFKNGQWEEIEETRSLVDAVRKAEEYAARHRGQSEAEARLRVFGLVA